MSQLPPSSSSLASTLSEVGRDPEPAHELPPPPPGSTPLPPPVWQRPELSDASSGPPPAWHGPSVSRPPGADRGGRRHAPGDEPPAGSPPPAPPRDREPRPSRSTAATWVAAAGALLLLAAAATFLAVSWDTLALTARIAVVGAGTAAAILGGHRLRRRLPAVGAVVYHLGALLVPVDALGLALQMDVDPASRWLAVGATAVVILPPLALAGRTAVLAWGAAAGVPVLATGLGLSTPVAAPLFVAAIALAGVVTAARWPGGSSLLAGRRRSVLAATSTALAVFAVGAPIAVAAVVAMPTHGGAVLELAAAGWQPTSWQTVAVVVTIAVTALVVATTRAASPRLALLTLTTAAVGALSALIPVAPDDAVLIVLPAVVVLLVELAATAARGHRLWQHPTARFAGAIELLAVPVAAIAVMTVLAVVQLGADPSGAGSWAVAVAVLAVAWAVGSVRRYLDVGVQSPLVVAAAGLAIVHAAVAPALVGVAPAVTIAVLIAGAVGSVIWRPERAGTGAWIAAVVASGALHGMAWLVALGGSGLTAITVSVAVVGALHLRAVADRQDGAARSVAVLLAIGSVALIGLAAAALAASGHAAADLAGVLVVAALLGLATGSGPRDELSDGVRIVAAALAVVVTSPLLGGLGTWAASGGSASWMVGQVIVVGPAALLPAALAGTWLLLESAVWRRTVVAALAVPALLRAVVSVAAIAGVDRPLTGYMLVALAIVASLMLALGVRRWVAPIATLAVTAVVFGVPLAGLTPELWAVLAIAVGLLVAAAGAVRQQAGIAHLGGIVALLGWWRLFGLRDVEALDVWVLPLAAQVWAAGAVSRWRDGTSSWIADVPPLLLVAIPAMLERAAGGSGWHAVLAGGLGVIAVIGGGSARLGGPLVTGTAVLLGVVAIELFTVVVAVPTWIWLGLGGVTLLAAGAALEAVEGSPAAVAKRLVGVLRERFH